MRPPHTGLPVEDAVADVRTALARHGAAVLQAEPGAGKSTVVPLRLVGEPWTLGGILVLEPRRLAARAVARRMADLLGEDVGATVGYRTRDDHRVGPTTRIEVVTDGILTRRLQTDPSLEGTGLVVFDEVHERNLQSDLALALTLDVRRSLRTDLRVLAMSATLEAERVAQLLAGDSAGATVVTAGGRTHAVEVLWEPPAASTRPAEGVAAAVLSALGRHPGDVLVFLPGAREIHRVASLLEGSASLPDDVGVHRLHGGLSPAEQDAALAGSPPGHRRVVLSTDIAETSLTVDGVRVVVDAGLVRRPRHDPRNGMERLHTTDASRASADQRAGRAGRTAPGVAIRLWDRASHAARRAHAPPEILGADLAGFSLELAMWGAGPSELPLLDQPPTGAVDTAHRLLRGLGALDEAGRPTEVGRRMAALPLHPRLAHMVVRSDEADRWLACVLAALSEERDVLRGSAREVGVDVAERVRAVTARGRAPAGADARTVAIVRTRARQVATRAGIRAPLRDSSRSGLDRSALEPCGRLLALAHPDRIAVAGPASDGRFRLPDGSHVRTPPGDPLAGERFLVVADVHRSSGDRHDEVRLAAALDADDLVGVAGHLLTTTAVTTWDDQRGDLVRRTETRLGAVVVSSVAARPPPGTEAVAALLARVRSTRLDALRWTDAARALQDRAATVRSIVGHEWPDVSDEALQEDLDEWLAPLLAGATGRADLERIDVRSVLRARLGHHRVAELDRLLPRSVELAGGRSVTIDYATDPPSISARAQDLFGTTVHPCIAGGRLPLTVQVLSPANRVVQVTADLPGFWAGSWSEVRKEMAGRYPKHDWPADPATASPRGARRRR